MNPLDDQNQVQMNQNQVQMLIFKWPRSLTGEMVIRVESDGNLIAISLVQSNNQFRTLEEKTADYFAFVITNATISPITVEHVSLNSKN